MSCMAVDSSLISFMAGIMSLKLHSVLTREDACKYFSPFTTFITQWFSKINNGGSQCVVNPPLPPPIVL